MLEIVLNLRTFKIYQKKKICLYFGCFIIVNILERKYLFPGILKYTRNSIFFFFLFIIDMKNLTHVCDKKFSFQN